MLPEQYICDNNTQSGAAWDLFREAAKYFYENPEPKFTFIGELDPIFARANWADLSPTLELSNDIIGASVASELGKIGSNEVLMETINRGTVQMFNRTWQDVKETQKMLEALELDGFTAASSPVVVNTMQLIAGSPQCQFYFVNDVYNPIYNPNPIQITYQPTWNSQSKQLFFEAGIIKHLTFGIDTISNIHAPNEYCYAFVEGHTYSLTDPDKTYYAYIDGGSTLADDAFWNLSETPLPFNYNGSYMLLAFLVGREINGQRNVTRMFGFTEILPGQITTDMIRSSDGNTYFDLVNNIVRGKFDFRDGLISSMIALTNNSGDNPNPYDVDIYLFDNIILVNGGSYYNVGDVVTLEFEVTLYPNNDRLLNIELVVDSISYGAISSFHVTKNQLAEHSDIIADFAGTVSPPNQQAVFDISSTLLPKNNNVTAGLQGDSAVNVGMWLGGTYTQALQGIANIIFYKDGTGKIGIFDV
jgi:hypothetical protein